MADIYGEYDSDSELYGEIASGDITLDAEIESITPIIVAEIVATGPKGKDGIDGKDGRDGIDGKDGRDGAPGRDGIDGRDGRDGVDGAPGTPGAPGAPGRDGVDGRDGEAATVSIGTVTTLPAGSDATVTNTGTQTNAVLNFGIPKGADGKGGTTEEVDPTVPAWAKQPTKPIYTAEEVGALPASTVIPVVPSNVSAFTNDAGYLTQHQDISGKQDVISDLSAIRSGAAAGATAYQKPTSGIPESDLVQNVQSSLDKANAISNPNLLINPWFTVNQRNQTAYGSSTSTTNDAGYSVDRWKYRLGYAQPVANGIRVNPNLYSGLTAKGFCIQSLENIEWYLGKAVTLSIDIAQLSLNGNAKVELCMYWGDSPHAATLAVKGHSPYSTKTTGILAGTFEVDDTIPLNNDGVPYPYLNFSVRMASLATTDNTSYYILRSAKLEIGNESTLAMDCEPSYTEEIVKCRRFYCNLKPQKTLCTFNGLCNTGGKIVYFDVTPGAMRTAKPTILYGGFSCYVRFGGYKNLTPTSISYAHGSVDLRVDTRCTIRLDFSEGTGDNQAVNVEVRSGVFALDAEM